VRHRGLLTESDAWLAPELLTQLTASIELSAASRYRE
jgi:hypothetical protein